MQKRRWKHEHQERTVDPHQQAGRHGQIEKLADPTGCSFDLSDHQRNYHCADELRQHLQAEGVIYDSRLTSEHIASLLRKRLQNTRVADWFSGRWTLYNECTILSTDADGQTVQQRPDRVMTDGRQWIVVDFKFGSPKPEYHDQVRRYMSLLASMGHQNIHGYLWYVYTNRIEEV